MARQARRKGRAGNGLRIPTPFGGGRKRTTGMTFSAEDLSELGRLVAVGQVHAQVSHAIPVVSRLKQAMTRMGLPTPKGL